MKRTGSKFDMQEEDQALYRPEFGSSKEDKNKGTKEKMWELMSTYLPATK